MKKEQKQKILLVALLGVGLIYAYSTYLFLPEWAKIKTLQKSLEARQGHYSELKTYRENQAGLQTEINQLQTKLKQPSVSVPEHMDKPKIVLYLHSTAKKYGVNPQAVKFEPIQQKGFYQEMLLTLTCEGKPEDIFALIQELKSGTEQRVIPQATSFTSQQGTMRGELKLVAYSLAK